MTRAGFLAALATALVVSLWAGAAQAQIRSSGRHPYYGVELEPHFIWQWSGDEWSWEDGIGLGVRASIPVIENGPVQTINNNLAVTFGFDIAWFDNDCRFGGVGVDCDETDIWIPVAVQWNFFVSQVVSLFPEFGLGFRNAARSDAWCGVADCDDSDLEVHAVLWFGARFLVADRIALTVRLGTPSLLFGVSFLL